MREKYKSGSVRENLNGKGGCEMTSTKQVLGISASPRGLRHGDGSRLLIDEIHKIQTREHLTEYLNNQAQLCVGAFVEAGSKEHKTFDKIYRKLSQLPGTYGLCNSETLLAAGLWGAKNNGAEIEHTNLSDYFGNQQSTLRHLDLLMEKVRAADAILLAGPVYFGDRSSLAHDFLRIMRGEPSLVADKLFAGLAVGAKRNGGQETLLIYQMLDFANVGMLGVGNDSDTTAQYGGTGHGGDVGTGAKDEYGINTSVGTGNRVAQVLKVKEYSASCKLKDKVKIGVIMLQDVGKKTKHFVEKHILASELANKADFRFFYFVNEPLRRCIGCDMCPTTIGKDEVYRCIIQDKRDLFVKYHKELVDLDAILIGGYSPESYDNVTSIYQTYIERTRYLRRSDYVYTDCLVAPFVFQEVGSTEDLQIRTLTSMIRHHTIMHKPILFYVQDGELIRFNDSYRNLTSFVEKASKLTAGRIMYHSSAESYSSYNPLGYTLKTERDRLPENVQRRKENIENRRENFCRMLKERVQQ